MGNSDFEDSLERLNKLTQEEARMASAELLKVTHVIDEKVTDVDKRVKGVVETVKGFEEDVQNVRSDVQDVSNTVEGIKGNIQDVHSDVQDIGNKVLNLGDDVKDISGGIQNIAEKVDQVYRSLSLDPCSSVRGLRQVHREARHRCSLQMAFGPRSIHQSTQCTQISSRRYSPMVPSRKNIQSMEIIGLFIMDTWKTCVALDFQDMLAPNHLSFL